MAIPTRPAPNADPKEIDLMRGVTKFDAMAGRIGAPAQSIHSLHTTLTEVATRYFDALSHLGDAEVADAYDADNAQPEPTKFDRAAQDVMGEARVALGAVLTGTAPGSSLSHTAELLEIVQLLCELAPELRPGLQAACADPVE